MPFKLEFDSQEAAPEGIREQLTQVGEKWLFEGETAAEVANLRKSNKTLRKFEEEIKQIKPKFEKLAAFADLDDDELQQLLEAKAARENGTNGNGDGHKPGTDVAELQAKYQQEIAQREKKLKEAHARELSEREARIHAAEAKLNDYVLDTEIAGWGAKYKADPDARKALLKIARDHFRLDEKGKVIAMDEDGDPLPESAEEFFANKFKNANKYLFLSDEIGGTGPEGNKKPSGKFAGLKKSSMDAAAVAKFIREHGGEAYKALPA